MDKTNLSTDNSGAYAITVSGGLVYTAGYNYDSALGAVACYWKDDGTTVTETDLTGSATVGSWGMGIFLVEP